MEGRERSGGPFGGPGEVGRSNRIVRRPLRIAGCDREAHPDGPEWQEAQPDGREALPQGWKRS